MTSDHKSIINNRSLNAFCCSSFHDLATCSIHLLHRSIHLSIQCRCMIVIRILFYFFFFSFLSLSLSFTQDVIIRVSRKLFIILKLSSLFLFLSLISVNFWQWHPMNSCAIVILSKLGRFNHLRSINIYIYIHIFYSHLTTVQFCLTYDEAFQILIESSREMKRPLLSGSMRTCKYNDVQFTRSLGKLFD